MKVNELTVPKGYTLQKVGITQSLLGSFLKCRRKFLIAINKYYIPSSSAAMHFGDMGHAMLQSYYTKGSYNIKKHRNNEFRLDQQEVERQKTVMEPLLSEYRKLYSYLEFKEIETMFTVRLNRYQVHIKIDGMTQDEKYLVDHKFRGKINEDEIMEQLSFDYQSLFYIIVLEEYFNHTFKGAYNNIIRHPGHKKGKDDKSVKAFQNRLLIEIQKNRDHFYKRFKIPFTKKEKAEYKEELIEGKLKEVEMCLKGQLPFYKNEMSCKSGYSTCQFLNVCSSGVLDTCKKRKYLFPELKM